MQQRPPMAGPIRSRRMQSSPNTGPAPTGGVQPRRMLPPPPRQLGGVPPGGTLATEMPPGAMPTGGTLATEMPPGAMPTGGMQPSLDRQAQADKLHSTLSGMSSGPTGGGMQAAPMQTGSVPPGGYPRGNMNVGGNMNAGGGMAGGLGGMGAGMKRGGAVKAKAPVKKMSSGGSTSKASSRGDGIAQRGKTKGRYI